MLDFGLDVGQNEGSRGGEDGNVRYLCFYLTRGGNLTLWRCILHLPGPGPFLGTRGDEVSLHKVYIPVFIRVPVDMDAG